jgi:mitochondrial distribution and morphology protein 31
MSKSLSTAALGRQLWTAVRGVAEPSIARFSAPRSTTAAYPQPFTFPASTLRRGIHTQTQWQFSRIHGQGQNRYKTKRSFTGGGLLLLGYGTSSPSTQSVVASCTAAADSALLGSTPANSNIYYTSRQAWQRNMHASPRALVRWKHTDAKSEGEVGGKPAPTPPKEGPNSPEVGKSEVSQQEAESIASSVSKYFHLPPMPHRPTREELLAAANGFWERLRVRFKWVSIRSMRPWNIDEWGAFISWLLLGHIVWVLVGTTTFFSILIFSINTVFAQGLYTFFGLRNNALTSTVETLAKWIGDYLTQSAGITVIFESAIVPKWKDGVISFRNVFVSRRPGQIKSSVSKGSSSNAAAVAAAQRGSDQDGQVVEVDDGNYTQFDVTIATVNVTLSFVKWWNGKGLLKDVEVKGVRGVVDRTSVVWSSKNVDPFSYRRTHTPGDFEIDSFKLEDLLLTVHQPGGFRPFSVSIYSCELPQLRRQWLFYDILSANHMSGSFDGSLFTIHPKQMPGSVAAHGLQPADSYGEPGAWKKFSRLRIDGLKIDHLNRGVEGLFGWIYEGNVDIIADVMFPNDADESIGKVMSDFYDQLEEVVNANRRKFLSVEAPQELGTPSVGHIIEAESLPAPAPPAQGAEPEFTPPIQPSEPLSEDDRRFLVMDLRIHLNEVKAAVPLFTRDISYINQALVRPIVAYINAKRTYIPISCRIVKRASDFDGSWTVFDCGLMNDLSAETYEAFARDVEDQHSRVRRLRKVGFWTLSVAVHAIFMGMAGNVI